jgi:CheY-like chemotaxis protein/signal transduction histidine kinase
LFFNACLFFGPEPGTGALQFRIFFFAEAEPAVFQLGSTQPVVSGRGIFPGEAPPAYLQPVRLTGAKEQIRMGALCSTTTASQSAAVSDFPPQNVPTAPQVSKTTGVAASVASETAASVAPSGTERSQGNVIRVLSNHIQNSLHVLDLTACSMSESLSADIPSELKQDLADIVITAKQTHMLVNDLLTLTRLHQRSLSTGAASVPEVVCLRQRLKDAVESLGGALRAPLSLFVAANVPSLIVLDVEGLSQVLGDALLLSARYCEAQGSSIVVNAYIKSAAESGRLVIEVMDCGSSMGLGEGVDGNAIKAALQRDDRTTILRGQRAQRLAIFVAVAQTILSSMGGGDVDVQECDAVLAVGRTEGATKTPKNEQNPRALRVVKVSLTIPFTIPSEKEKQRAGQDLAAALQNELEGINLPPLPNPFCCATGSESRTASVSPPLFTTDLPSGQAGLSSLGSGASAVPPSPLVSDKGYKTREDASAAGADLKRFGSKNQLLAAEGAGTSGGPSAGKAPVGLDGEMLRQHVLLVDDMAIIRRLGENYLAQLGCTSVTLEDGDQVEAALSNTTRPFDALVLDISMQRSDGAIICQTLREKFGVKAPIIAMTGQTSARDLQRYYQLGFDCVLPKPFTRDALGRALVEGRNR